MAGHDMGSMESAGSGAPDCGETMPSTADPMAGHDMGSMEGIGSDAPDCAETPPPASDPLPGHDMNSMEGIDHGAMSGGGTTEGSSSSASDPMAGHDMDSMEGMDHGAMSGGEATEGSSSSAADPMAGHDMDSMEGMDHGAMSSGGTTEGSSSSAADPMTDHDMDAMEGMDHGAMSGGGTTESMDHAAMSSGGTMEGMDHAAMSGGGTMEGMDHSAMSGGGTMEGMDHSAMSGGGTMEGMDHGAMEGMERAAVANASPPAAAFSGPVHAADLYYGVEAMTEGREHLDAEMGEIRAYRVLVDQLEIRPQEAEDVFLWDAEAWFGGDINKLWIKTEGELSFGESLEGGEVQALWSRAITPWTEFQTGVRYDFGDDAERAHLVVGLQSLLPYFYELEAAAFVSEEGDITARAEAEYDMLLTQKLILQPTAEIEFAAQDIPDLGIGAGLYSIEAGLRLRYEFIPEFAPYVGIGYERLVGDTADLARAEGEHVGGWSGIFGVRVWF